MFSLKLATLSLPGPHRDAEAAGTASGGDVGRAAGQAKMDPRGAGSPEGGGEAAAAAGGPGEEAPGRPACGLPRRPLRPPSPTGPEVWLVPCSWESTPGWHFLGVESDLTLSGKGNSIIFPNLYGQQES